MGIILWLIISLVIAAPYIVFFFRRKSGEASPVGWGMDWVSLLATTFGGLAFGFLMTWNTVLSFPLLIVLVIPALLIGILMFFLPTKVKTEVMKPNIDERVATISAKSARNALLVTYLVLVILLIADQASLKSTLLVLLPGSGLLVFYSSYLFYFYARS